jgi:hypothetical protein
MEWLFTAALLPLVLCGVMCVGGALLAAFGIRRSTCRRSARPAEEPASEASQEALTR